MLVQPNTMSGFNLDFQKSLPMFTVIEYLLTYGKEI